MIGDGTSDVDKILGYALLAGAKEVTRGTLKTIKKTWLKNKYGITIKPTEGNKLKDISQNKIYIAFKKCVGNDFEYTNYIKIGILIYELNCQGDYERVFEIRNELYNSRRYNHYVKKTIHIASTGVLLNVLDYLTEIKCKKRLTKYGVQNEFKKILDNWKNLSISVKNTDNFTVVKNKILSLMKNGEPFVILYASGRAVDKAHDVVAFLRNKKLFLGKYLDWSKNLSLFGFLQYFCIFEKLTEFKSNSFFR